MALADIGLSALAPFACTFDGAWHDARNSARWRQREWRGQLRSDQPFVAVCLAGTETTLDWCRTPWPAAPAYEVRFVFSVFGPALLNFNAHLTIGGAIAQVAGEIAVSDHDAIAFAGGPLKGGSIEPLVHVGGSTTATLGAWLIHAGDARSARNRTWHLRSQLPPHADARAVRILGGKRNGSMSWR